MSPSGDFWFGLDNIHTLCNENISCQLRVDLTYNHSHYHAMYREFRVAGEDDLFRLTIHGYSGTAGDAMAETAFFNHGKLLENLDGMAFTTTDMDNDLLSGNNCGYLYGGWWHRSCSLSRLNGDWADSYTYGLVWSPLTGIYSVSKSEMKVRHMF